MLGEVFLVREKLRFFGVMVFELSNFGLIKRGF